MAFYVVDGLNICREEFPLRITALLSLLLTLKRSGHGFICLFDQDAFSLFAKGKPVDDATARVYREMTNTRSEFNQFFKQVRGKADAKILDLAHNNRDYTIISNDKYRNFKSTYQWLSDKNRFVSGVSVFAGQIVCEELNIAISEEQDVGRVWNQLSQLLAQSSGAVPGRRASAGRTPSKTELPTKSETSTRRVKDGRSMKKCPECGRLFDMTMRFCQADGTPLRIADDADLSGNPYSTNKSGEGSLKTNSSGGGRGSVNTSSRSSGNSGNVIEDLLESGTINPEVAEVLQYGIEEKPTQVLTNHTEIVALVIVIDKSSSMKPWTEAVIDGQHEMLNALLGASPHAYDIRLAQILFNHEVEYFQRFSKFRDDDDPMRTHPDVQVLDKSNYRPGGYTALYDAILQGICALTPLIHWATEEGITLESRVGILTDGCDQGEIGPGSKVPPHALRKAIDFLTSKGLLSSITLVGIGDYDYISVGKEIGIDNVISLTADAKSIRRAFELFSSR